MTSSFHSIAIDFVNRLDVVVSSRLILNLREENLRRSTPNASIIAPDDRHGIDAWDDNLHNLFSDISTVDKMVFQDRRSGLTLFSIDGMLPIRDSEIFGVESEVNVGRCEEVELEAGNHGDDSCDEDGGSGGSSGRGSTS